MINLKNVLCLFVFTLLSLGALANNPVKTSETKEATETKETKVAKAERPLVTSFFGGMMLTKITLENQTSLVPYAYSDDTDYAERCEGLTGLVVFHIASKKNAKMPSGMYVWDGEQWQQASFQLAVNTYK